MRGAVIFRITVTGACLLALPMARAQGRGLGGEQLLHYECVFEQPCGTVSTVCWASGHPWGGTHCTYCTGNQTQDLCQRSNGGSCPYINKNQSCGTMQLSGTCTATGGGLGTCTGGVPSENPCTVPMC